MDTMVGVVVVVAMDLPIEDLDMRMTVKWEEGMVTVMKDLLAALRGDIKTGREVVEVMVMHLTEEVLKGTD